MQMVLVNTFLHDTLNHLSVMLSKKQITINSTDTMNKFQNRLIVLGLFLACVITNMQAENVTLSGRVCGLATKEPIVQAIVQLLQLPDSTVVSNKATDTQGFYAFENVRKGNYALKATYVGMTTRIVPVTITGQSSTQRMRTILLREDAIMLKEAVVTAAAAKVEVKEDTMVYNADAYRTHVGATVEDLVKRIPGAEVSDDGTVTINGQEIKKILVDGKEYFQQDPTIALKNLPVSAIKSVKSYNKQSDMARVSGIDDGNDEAVLDLTIKKGQKKGLFGNTDMAYGTEDRYLAKGMLNSFMDDKQLSAFVNINNINDKGYGNAGFHRMRQSTGLNAKKSAGLHIANSWDKVELGGSVSYNDDDQDLVKTGATETFLQDNNTFGRSYSVTRNKVDKLNADFQIEWEITPTTTLLYYPSMQYSKTDKLINSKNLTANEVITRSLSKDFDIVEDEENFPGLINQNISNNLTESNSIGTDGDIQLNQRLSDNGRNLLLRFKYNIDRSESDVYQENDVYYYLTDTEDIHTNRYTDTENTSSSYRLQAAYSEPIAKNQYLQLDYQYNFKHSERDKSMYDYSDPQNMTLLGDQSLNYENDYVTQRIRMGYRYATKALNLTAGVDLMPQSSTTSYVQNGQKQEVEKEIFTWAPFLEFKRTFSKTSALRIKYKGRASMPSMAALSPIADTSNPLQTVFGNTELKPSMTHQFRVHFNTFDRKSQTGMFAGAFFNATENDVAYLTVYDTETGYTETTPQNIDGNWTAMGIFAFNTALKNKNFTLSNMINPRYSRSKSFMQSNLGEVAEENTTKDFTLEDRLRFGYRNDSWDAGLVATMRYNNSENTLNTTNDRKTYDYSFGGETHLTLPWGIDFSTDASYAFRRGYSEGLNREELVWNAQIAKSFGRRKNLTISLQGLDLLDRQTNIMSNISQTMRSDNQYNGVNSYFMVHLIYRLDIFGNGDSQERMGPGGPPPGGPRGRGRGGRRRPF